MLDQKLGKSESNVVSRIVDLCLSFNSLLYALESLQIHFGIRLTCLIVNIKIFGEMVSQIPNEVQCMLF